MRILDSYARQIKVFNNMQHKRLIIILISSAILLLIPFIAMQFTDVVNWTLSDFLIAAVLLLSAGLAIDFIIRKVKRKKYRIVLAMAILAILLLVWAELAVGILGTPVGGN